MRIGSAYHEAVHNAAEDVITLEKLLQSGSAAAKEARDPMLVPNSLVGKFIVTGRDFREEVTNLALALIVLECNTAALNIWHEIDQRRRLVVFNG